MRRLTTEFLAAAQLRFTVCRQNSAQIGRKTQILGEVTSGQEQAIWFELRSNDGIVVHINVRFGRLVLKNSKRVIKTSKNKHSEWVTMRQFSIRTKRESGNTRIATK